jgi:hypothetical protein
MTDTLESLEHELAAYWEKRMIELTINGVNGVMTVSFPANAWIAMSPIARVLAIHEKARAVTNGETFDVTGENYRKA